MNKSESIKELATALSSFQGKMRSVQKTEINPFFKKKYANLDSIWEACKTLMSEHGLSISQFPAGDNELTSILMHSSGEWLEATTKMNLAKTDPQGHGSAITYMRRYAMSAILGIVTDEDDDGNQASMVKTPVKQAKQAKQSQVTINDVYTAGLDKGMLTDAVDKMYLDKKKKPLSSATPAELAGFETYLNNLK